MGAFTGMDVYAKMIAHLDAHRPSDACRCFTVPFRNARYNPEGIALTADAELPGDIRQHDLIALQSVFTHFAPADFEALLHVLRRHAATGARLLFTCFIDNEQAVDFVDAVPERPLLSARYRESAVRSMLEATNWKVLSFHEPGMQMQHQFVYEPAPVWTRFCVNLRPIGWRP